MARKTVWRKCEGCTATTSRRFCWLCALKYIEELEAEGGFRHSKKKSKADPYSGSPRCHSCSTVDNTMEYLYVNENFTKAGVVCERCFAGFRRKLLRNGGEFTVT